MKKVETGIEGLIIVEPQVFEDERGYFMETFSKSKMAELGIDEDFIQDNESKSSYGVLRGVHFQTTNPQGKLVRCSQGKIWDVAVDLREESATFGQWFGVELSSDNKKMMYIPPRFGHGFVVLSETAIFNYKCTQEYHPASDSGIAWNSQELNIEWPSIDEEPTISAKDQNHTLKLEEIKWDN